MPSLVASAQSFPIAGRFTISRGSKTSADVILAEVSDGQHLGRGEAVPYGRYNETVMASLAALRALKGVPGRDGLSSLHLPKSAQNALDCALWDLEAKQKGQSLWHMLGVPAPKPLTTCFTISLDAPEKMAADAAKAAHMPLLKLKLGREGDEQRLAAVRAAVPRARLVVDANEGWSVANLAAMLKACAAQGVELVEQPLPQGQDEILHHMPHEVLICADESAHDVASLAGLRGKYDAVNIKLDKTGGLSEALAMRYAAKALGFKVMVGCMLATSLAMAPAFYLAQGADYVDLDGPLLLAEDRTPSIAYERGVMQLPPRALWG